MIERKFNGLYTLTCDICGEEKTFDTFDKAVDYKIDEGWKSQKHKGEWEDVCPECQEV